MLRDCYDPRGTIARIPYVLIGLGGLAVKIAVDAGICALIGATWRPTLYLSTIVLDQAGDPRLAPALLAASLPFAWMGLALSIRRLRDAAAPPWLALMFMIPVLNWCLLGVASLLPTATAGEATDDQEPSDAIVGPLLLSILVTCGVLLVAARLARSYGFGLFIALPFVIGYLAVALSPSVRRSLGQSLGRSALAGACSAGALLILGIEGVICILMAAPLTTPLAMLGGAVAYAVFARRPGLAHGRSACALPLIIPAMIGLESAAPLEPPVHPVVTSTVVAADAQTVWENVVAFPPLSEPTDWVFTSGIAYPIGATIAGRGVGAVRRCEFSTGAFIEPITVWDEPRLLRFTVSECPAPMTEWSPWAIHPPHLDGFMVARQGQFALEALPDGRTRIVGTTWYRHGLWPETYWRWWSDAIVHRIHDRVLDHIRTVSEGSGLAATR